MSDGLTSKLEIALRAARLAGEATLHYFARDGLHIEIKSDGSPVTVADRQAETIIRNLLASECPDDSIVGEELPPSNGHSQYTWIIDPIDGTFSFVHGVPLYGTLIGLEHAGETVVGVVHMPALHETVYAARGQGTWHRVGSSQPVRAHVSLTAPLAQATCCTTSFDYFQQTGTEASHDRLLRAARNTRGWSDSYAAILLATGRVDAVVEPLMHPWDIAALYPVIREAGGRCTDWAGTDTISSGHSVMTNGKIHDEILSLLTPPHPRT